MGSSAVYELAVLLTLKDALSGGLDRVEDRLRATGKEGRQLLTTVQDLRKDLRQGLTLAGVGVTTLVGLKKGVDVAGDFESAITDLRLSIEELDKTGNVNLQQLGNQLTRFEQLGMRLGNALPGSTQDFIEAFAVLKQGGLETETILNGAGEAAAHLAVVMKEQPKALAEPLAQYGKMFAFQADEYVKAADLFSRIYRATGLRSGELIEGSKFFQLRAGAPLGLKGIEGGEIGARLMAALKSYGLEGGIGGREAAVFFSHLATHKDALQKVKKEFGIDLQIFDKKGNFLGFDNVFKQMEKLRGLKTQQQMEAFKLIGGEEGAGIGNIFMQMGEAGWKAQYEKLSKIPPLQTQINEATQTYNAKMEAVLGTLENLKATAFTPLLDQAKPLLDTANKFAGFVQEFSKAHPTITLIATDLVVIGGVTLTVVGTVKALTAAWKLWRIASAVSSNETAIVSFLRNTRTTTDSVGTSLTTTSTKAGGLKRSLKDLTSSPFKVIMLLESVGYTIGQVVDLINAVKEYNRTEVYFKQTADEGAKSYEKLASTYRSQGQQVPQKDIEFSARTALRGIDLEGTLKESLTGGTIAEWRNLWGIGGQDQGIMEGRYTNWLLGPWRKELRPFTNYDQSSQIALIQQRAPRLKEPEVMASARKQVAGWSDVPEYGKKAFLDLLQKSFADSFQKSSEIITAQAQQNAELEKQLFVPLQELPGLFTALTAPLQQTNESVVKLPDAFRRAEISANKTSTSLDLFSLKLAGFSVPSYFGPPPAGGDTSSPAEPIKPTFQQPPSSPFLPFGKTSSSKSVGDIHIHVPPGAAAANSPQELAKLVQGAVREALAEPDGFGQLLSSNSALIEDVVARRIALRKERA